MSLASNIDREARWVDELLHHPKKPWETIVSIYRRIIRNQVVQAFVHPEYVETSGGHKCMPLAGFGEV